MVRFSFFWLPVSRRWRPAEWGREDSLAGRRLDHSPPAMNRHREADCACPLPVIREQSGQPHTGLQTCGRSFAMRKQWIRRDGQFVAKPTLFCATMECLAGNWPNALGNSILLQLDIH